MYKEETNKKIMLARQPICIATWASFHVLLFIITSILKFGVYNFPVYFTNFDVRALYCKIEITL